MSDSGPPPRGGRAGSGARAPGRPRSPRADRAILEATLALLAEAGVHGLTVEAVAARAGVGKATIYRRWPSKEVLVAEALGRVGDEVVVPDTGDVRADLLAVVAGVRDLTTRTGVDAALAQVVTATTDPELMDRYWARFAAPRRAAVAQILERAKARGQVRADVEPDLVMDLLGGALLYHLLMGLRVPTQRASLPERLVDTLWRGIAAG